MYIEKKGRTWSGRFRRRIWGGIRRRGKNFLAVANYIVLLNLHCNVNLQKYIIEAKCKCFQKVSAFRKKVEYSETSNGDHLDKNIIKCGLCIGDLFIYIIYINVINKILLCSFINFEGWHPSSSEIANKTNKHDFISIISGHDCCHVLVMPFLLVAHLL